SGRHLGRGRAEAARSPGAIFEPGTGDTAAAAAPAERGDSDTAAPGGSVKLPDRP
ncbi:hypothetical protein Nmel_017805, partial [Mimus melanotis]